MLPSMSQYRVTGELTWNLGFTPSVAAAASTPLLQQLARA